jgi:DinB family protein
MPKGEIALTRVQMVAVVLLLSAMGVASSRRFESLPNHAPSVTNTEQLIVPAADALPEEKYSFAPSSGEFLGVRTFAEQVKHIAAANYQLAAAALGEEAPAGTDHETAPDSVKTKVPVMDYLKGSFASLHRAAAALKEKNMDDPIPSKGNRTRLLMLIDAVVHSSNHYGQMVEYLRMNNIVPPESR